jgi:hypothetical protein
MARDGTATQKEKVASALGSLAQGNDRNQNAIREGGGVAALVAMARDGTATQKEQAASALSKFGLIDFTESRSDDSGNSTDPSSDGYSHASDDHPEGIDFFDERDVSFPEEEGFRDEGYDDNLTTEPGPNDTIPADDGRDGDFQESEPDHDEVGAFSAALCAICYAL